VDTPQVACRKWSGRDSGNTLVFNAPVNFGGLTGAAYTNLQQLAHHKSVGGKLEIMGRNKEAQLK
jgi:hypothetical protein